MVQYNGRPIRDQFDLDPETVYLRTGNICPCPREAALAVEDFLDVWRRKGDACWTTADDAFNEAKSLFGKLINADPNNIATIENTSMGLSIAAGLIAPRRGANVVVDELSHQSNVYPWAVRPDVEIRYARAENGVVPLSEFERLVDSYTAAVDVCHVTMAHGFRFDLAELAELTHGCGAYLVVDAAQSAGAVEIDVEKMGVDFLACPTFKWLLGPLGCGFLAVRPGLVDLNPPPMVGWMSGKHPERFDIHAVDLHDDARRLQRGVHNAMGIVAAAAGLRILDRIGPSEIHAHVARLSGRLIDGLRDLGLTVLTPAEPDRHGSIIAFEVPDAAAFNDGLAQRSIQAGQYLPGQIRCDVSIFCDDADMDRTLEAIRSCASAAGLI
jgi:selenocysteine lyase/cysteine desulfurase